MIDLLIVAGAGASHKLGVGDSALPLMGHWAETLCRQLDAEESGLADACGLDQEFDGEAFEIALGQVLEWDQARSLEEKFEPLALNNFNGPPKEKVRHARRNTEDRLVKFKRAINDTLYMQFGLDKVDDQKAETAYGSLLKQLGNPRIALATTNYDRSAESALMGLDHTIVNGFIGGHRGVRFSNRQVLPSTGKLALPFFTYTAPSAGTSARVK